MTSHICKLEKKMSDKNSQPPADANPGSSGSKQASPGDDTSARTADTQNVPSSGGHEETGVEKIFSGGGSGGQAVRSGQGYEHLAQH